MNIFFNRSESKISLKSLFINQVLSGDYKSTIETSSELLNVNPHYSLISIVLNKDQKNLKNYLETHKIELDFVLYLIQQNMCLEFTLNYINNIKVRDYLYFICLKELLIKNVIEVDCNLIIDKIDDFGIYKYCIDNKIQVNTRDTINYQYYKVYMKNFESLNDLLLKVKVYKDLENLLKISGVTEHPDLLVDNIIKFLNKGYNEEFCKINIQKGDKQKGDIQKGDIGIIKLVLAHLISSRDTKNLVLALYLARKYAFSVLENYEIDLIYLFLLKYFLFNWDLLEVFKKLDIKNNQMLYMSFIWSDVYLNLQKTRRVYNHEMKNRFVEYIDEVKSSIISSLPAFIDSNKISYALNMIELYKKVENNIVLKELQKGVFVKQESNDFEQFKYHLGSHCAYLFDKNKDFYEVKYPVDVFKNDIFNIEDEEFIEWFLKNKKLYN